MVRVNVSRRDRLHSETLREVAQERVPPHVPTLERPLQLDEEAIPAESAWEAVSLDEQWQSEQWGVDADAQAALDNRRADFLAAARFLTLLD